MRTTSGFPCPICTNPHKGKVNLRQHLPICVEKNGLTGEQRHKLLKIKLKECRHCKRWFSPSTIPSHERKCEAEHRTNDQSDYNQIWGRYGDQVLYEVKEVLTESRATWVSEMSWDEVTVYRYAPSTLVVPVGCRSEFHKAFTICQYLHIEGYEADAYKLHLIMIRSILAPVERKMVDTAGGPAPDPTSNTSAHTAVKARLRRWFAGEWEELWGEANLDRPISFVARNAEMMEKAKQKKAERQTLNGQLKDRMNTLTQPGMVLLREKDAQDQL